MSVTLCLGTAFFIISCFPWVGFFPMDTQPFAALAALLYLLSEILFSKRSFRIPSYIIFSGFAVTIGVIYSLLVSRGLGFLAFRGSIMYICIPIYLLAYSTFIRNHSFPRRLFIWINLAWIVAAVFQGLFSNDIFSMIVSIRTTANRGFTSLSPEPTFFGIYLFFASWILVETKNHNLSNASKFLLSLNFLSIIFLARSSMAVLFCILALGFIFLNQVLRNRFRSTLFIFIAAVSTCLLFSSVFIFYFYDSRLFSVYSLAISSPLSLFEFDASSNSRLSSVILPMHAFLLNNFLPHGFDHYPTVAPQVASFYGDFFFYEFNKFKIESWIGSLLFELGIFGLLLLIFVFRKLVISNPRSITSASIFFLLLFSAIPTGFPLVYLLIVLFVVNGSQNNKYSTLPRINPSYHE